MSEPKSCNLKFYQRTFNLQENLASSCCKSYSEPLDSANTLQFYLDKWQNEERLLDQGVKLTNCELCWMHEDHGQISHRMLHGKSKPQIHFDIGLSNLCNQMCSYCSPKYSSQWEKTILTQGNFVNVSKTVRNNFTVADKTTDNDHWLKQIADHISTCQDNSVEIVLLGGEPLMHLDTLQKLDLFHIEKLKSILLQTNLNPPTNKFLKWVIENFPKEKLKFGVSLDCSPEYMHIPRAGFDAIKFNDNLELLKNHNISIFFNCVISALSIFDLDNFLTYLQTQGINHAFKQVSNPQCLNPIYIPKQFRDQIRQHCAGQQIPEIFEKILDFDQPEDRIKLYEQYHYLQQYFERANIDINQSHNELLKEYWNWLTKKHKV